MQVQSKHIKILEKKKSSNQIGVLEGKKKKREKKDSSPIKSKTLFISLLAPFIYLIEIEVSYSLLEKILAKINNAPQEEIKNVFYLFILTLYAWFLLLLVCYHDKENLKHGAS